MQYCLQRNSTQYPALQATDPRRINELEFFL